MSKIKGLPLSPISLITLAVGVLLTLLAGFLPVSSECSATDSTGHPSVQQSYRAITKERACKKAFTMCTYYSSKPQDCRIKAE